MKKVQSKIIIIFILVLALLGITYSSKFITEKASIKNYITYTLPESWKENPMDKLQNDRYNRLLGTATEQLNYLSSDYKSNEGGFIAAGIYVSIRRSPLERLKIENFIANPEDSYGVKPDTKPILIGGLNGYVRHWAWEGYGRKYIVLKTPYVWEIQIGLAGKRAEDLHQREIDLFISSIKFK